MTILIKIFADFTTSIDCKQQFENVFQTNTIDEYGPDKDYYITADDNFTHVIILNKVMPDIRHIPKENVIGLAYEPIGFLGLTAEFVQYAQKYIGKYYIGDLYNLPTNVFVEKYSYMIHNPPLYSLPTKSKLMSIMVSHKQYAPGHKYRHLLVQSILFLKLPIDIYGNGCTLYQNDNHLNNVKGPFEKYEPYLDYQFHICIENFTSNHYFSEKIINTLLCETTPIYLGCKNIDTYFPNQVVGLTGVLQNDIDMLINIINNPNHYIKNIDSLKIKDQVNIVKHIPEIFHT